MAINIVYETGTLGSSGAEDITTSVKGIVGVTLSVWDSSADRWAAQEYRHTSSDTAFFRVLYWNDPPHDDKVRVLYGSHFNGQDYRLLLFVNVP